MQLCFFFSNFRGLLSVQICFLHTWFNCWISHLIWFSHWRFGRCEPLLQRGNCVPIRLHGDAEHRLSTAPRIHPNLVLFMQTRGWGVFHLKKFFGNWPARITFADNFALQAARKNKLLSWEEQGKGRVILLLAVTVFGGIVYIISASEWDIKRIFMVFKTTGERIMKPTLYLMHVSWFH